MISNAYRRLFIAACAIASRSGPFGVREQYERAPYTRPQHVVMWGGAAAVVLVMVAEALGVRTGTVGAAVAGGAGVGAMATLLYGRPPRRPL